MLSMTQIEYIRKMYYMEGKNISKISEATGKDRKTIREYVKRKDWNEVVKMQQPNSFLKLEPFKKIIDEWLLNDKQAKVKQRHTAKRVFERLKEIYPDNFNCSYRTIAAYVTLKKKEIYHKETGFIPLVHIAGEAQADFGEAEFIENGKKHCGKYLTLSFPYSNQGYFQLFYGENMECLLEGLKSIFEYIGGVPTRIWFDNTKTIVTKVLKEGGRQLTDKFLRFKEQYGFEAVFCNPNEGHEKGNVEGKVGYNRRNFLVPIPEFQELKEFNKELLIKCSEDGKREHYRKEAAIESLHEEDKKVLLKLPEIEFDTSNYVQVSTNGYGRFFLNNGLHEYSVSPKYANSKIFVKVTAFNVIPLNETGEGVVSHKRLYGQTKQQSMKWLPYLSQLAKRPGALKYSGIYSMFPEDMQNYLEKCTKQDIGKVLQTLSALTKESGFESAVNTVKTALVYDAIDVDSLVNLHRKLYNNVTELPPLKITSTLPELEKVKVDLSSYDRILGGAN